MNHTYRSTTNGIYATALTIAALISFLQNPSFAQQQTTKFEITISDSIDTQPVTGRLLVFLSQRNRNPMNGPSWFGPEPFFAIDVKDLKPGDAVTIDDSADSFPRKLSTLKPGTYYAQAILNHNFYQASHANGAGNFYSSPQQIKLGEGPIKFELSQTVAKTEHEDSKWVKFVTIHSKRLAEFHKRDVIERAMVVLPASYYDQPEKKYPTYYIVTGFGGTLKQLQQRWQRGQNKPGKNEAEFIRVYLTGQCKWGHHVYANSATNGPRGDCLINEMIPQIDKKFRTINQSTARFVGGHSSGGWSSLWLQVNYPESFGGVWSTAPDPVDFRDWQGTNLYTENANIYFDNDGKKKPLARFNNRVVAYYQDFAQMDDVLGNGGQIKSFDAVFSPLDENGKPKCCWNRKTGAVDTDVLEYWKKYDIGKILESNWDSLKSSLAGKIHVYMGDIDTFYLEGATQKLGQRMAKLNSDAVIEIFPDKDHSNLLDRKLRRRIAKEMTEAFRKNHPAE